MSVIAIKSDSSFVAATDSVADAKPYLIKGWKTDTMATGSKWDLGGMVVVTGTEQVGSLRCLVVEPVSKFAPTQEAMLARSRELAEAKKKAKK